MPNTIVNNDKRTPETQKPVVSVPTVYNPSEVVGIFAEALARRTAGLIHVRGIYHPGKGVPFGGYFYDTLRDEFSTKELPIVVSPHIRAQLVDGNLVDLKGLVDRKVANDCSVRLLLQVTGMSVVQEQTISEDDLKRIEIRGAKAKAGFKNVDGILESAIYADRRPSVGLIFADSSITDADFNKGKEAAGTLIDFREYRVSFARPDMFVQKLQEADGKGHDCVCIVRGGGAGLESLDNLSVLECVAGMKTAVVTAVGHTTDKVFINEIADLEIGTPSLLGSYFQNIVETVSKKKADSTAALTRKIEGQFKQQLETAKKQNEELQKQIAGLREASTNAQKLHDDQVKASRIITDDVVDRADELGYPGVYLYNVDDGEMLKDRRHTDPTKLYGVPSLYFKKGTVNELITFPGLTKRMKFIIGNNGAFDPTNEDKYSFNPKDYDVSGFV